jgi:flagellar L-ring protein precursor FlgH
MRRLFFSAAAMLMLTASVCLGQQAGGAGQAANNGVDPSLTQQAADSSRVQPPKKPATIQSIQDEMHRNGGSLLQASMATDSDPASADISSVSLFSVPPEEPRTLKKHDLVTIVINEQSTATSSGNTTLQKNADIDAKLDQFIELHAGELRGLTPGGAVVPEIKSELERDFTGAGTYDRSDTTITRLTAEIVDVKPNGNLVVQAEKTIKVDEELQHYLLTGICRAEDISTDNSILSTQLSDLTLVEDHKGAIADTQNRGWVPRLLDIVNPF